MNEPDSFINFKIPKGAPTWAVGIAVILIISITGIISFYKISQTEWKSYIDSRAAVLAKEVDIKQEIEKSSALQVAKSFEQKDKQFALIFDMATANMNQNVRQAEAISALQVVVAKQGEKLNTMAENLTLCQQNLELCQAKKGK